MRIHGIGMRRVLANLGTCACVLIGGCGESEGDNCRPDAVLDSSHDSAMLGTSVMEVKECPYICGDKCLKVNCVGPSLLTEYTKCGGQSPPDSACTSTELDLVIRNPNYASAPLLQPKFADFTDGTIWKQRISIADTPVHMFIPQGTYLEPPLLKADASTRFEVYVCPDGGKKRRLATSVPLFTWLKIPTVYAWFQWPPLEDCSCVDNPVPLDLDKCIK